MWRWRPVNVKKHTKGRRAGEKQSREQGNSVSPYPTFCDHPTLSIVPALTNCFLEFVSFPIDSKLLQKEEYVIFILGYLEPGT